MSETISVPMTAQRDIQTVTTEIRTLHRQAQGMILNYAIEIGRRLKEPRVCWSTANGANGWKTRWISAAPRPTIS
jgi:hypothetical protein